MAGNGWPTVDGRWKVAVSPSAGRSDDAVFLVRDCRWACSFGFILRLSDELVVGGLTIFKHGDDDGAPGRAAAAHGRAWHAPALRPPSPAAPAMVHGSGAGSLARRCRVMAFALVRRQLAAGVGDRFPVAELGHEWRNCRPRFTANAAAKNDTLASSANRRPALPEEGLAHAFTPRGS